MDKANLCSMAQQMKADDQFLILTHRRPDGDTVCSAAALCLALRRLGKRAMICWNPEITDRLKSYLTPYAGLPEDDQAYAVVTVDVASESQLSAPAREYADRIDYIIDHHMANAMAARVAKIDDPTAAATGELIFGLIQAMQLPMDRELATLLYIALATDTGCFLFANTTAQTHEIAAACLREGIELAALNHEFFEKKRRARIEIERMIYEEMQFFANDRIAAITVTQQMRRETGATEDDLDDLSSLPRKIEGVLAGVSAYEQSDGTTKISVRTNGAVDASAVCAAFGGGGHVGAAGCSLPVSPKDAVEAVCRKIADGLPDCNA